MIVVVDCRAVTASFEERGGGFVTLTIQFSQGDKSTRKATKGNP